MDNARFSNFASQQLLMRKRCSRRNNNPCPAEIKITNSNCVECANRYYQQLADTEREEMIDE